jgi:hypothetical protein
MQKESAIDLPTISNNVPRNSKTDKFLVILSSLGPILTIIFLVIAIPLLIEFYSIPGLREKDLFSESNITVLTNLMYLLYAFSLTSVFGLMMSLYHQKPLIITLNILSIIIGLVMFFPLLIAVIGD